jgi:sulfite reductase beta subunit-like hemoprotein
MCYSSSSKNARLKCAVHRMGLEVYKAEVEKLLGCPLQVARAYTFHRNVDDFGWHTSADGKHHFTMFIENGRIADQPGKDFKTGLREIAKVHKGTPDGEPASPGVGNRGRAPGRDQDAAEEVQDGQP